MKLIPKDILKKIDTNKFNMKKIDVKEIPNLIKTNKKIRTSILIIAASILLAIMTGINNSNETQIEGNRLKRPEAGSDAKQEKIDIYDSDGKLITTVDLSIEPRKLSESEVSDYFKRASDEINKKMLGKNQTLDEVRQDLNLITWCCNDVVKVDWYSGDYEVVNYNGKVDNYNFEDNESKKVNLKAVLSYETYNSELNYEITVLPRQDAKNQTIENIVAKKVNSKVNDSQENGEITLPDKVLDKQLSYRLNLGLTSPFFYILMGVAAVFLYYYSDFYNERQKAAKRIQEIKYDYSEVVSKIVLLLGSGMTIRLAWRKIVSDYLRDVKSGKIKKHAIYDEMYETECNMQAGISEALCYQNFGKRVNIKEYMKFASLLESSVKKGSKELLQLLDDEMGQAFTIRKQLALKKGEEASTKLLFPMLIMLAIVLAIVMVPALSSFGI